MHYYAVSLEGQEANNSGQSLGNWTRRLVSGHFLNNRRQGEPLLLVLSRKKNESIMVGHDVEIVIVEIRGDKVRLGIKAPKEIQVHRLEVFEAIERKKVEAA